MRIGKDENDDASTRPPRCSPCSLGSLRAWVHSSKTYLSSIGIGDLEERLDGKRFARVHRSHIIAFPAVDHLRSDGSGGYKVILDDGTKLRVSRSYAPDVRDRLV